MYILIVEDDPALSVALRTALQNQGYAANVVNTGKAALVTIKTDTPDIVILDLGLPDIDGLDILREAKKANGDIPILVLTARAHLDDKILGLDNGADDYLVKPFEMTELFARLRVLERRLTSTNSSEIRVGDLVLDINKNYISIEGREVELSRREFVLLKCLMENAGRVQTRSQLESRIYSWDDEVASNALEVHIHHLRKKLGTSYIKTVRGVGYKVGSE